MYMMNCFANISAFYAQNPYLFYTVIFAGVLLVTIFTSVLIIKSRDNKREDRLMHALDEMSEVQRREEEREAEKKRLAEMAEAERIKRAEERKKPKKNSSAKIVENTGKNGGSDTKVKDEKKAGVRRKKTAEEPTGDVGEKVDNE